jgi:hypothetical protein
MGKKLFVFCFTAVLAINGCIFNTSAVAQQDELSLGNDDSASEDIDTSAEGGDPADNAEETAEADNAGAEHAPISDNTEDAGDAAEIGAQPNAEPAGTTDNPVGNVQKEIGKSSTGAAEKTTEKKKAGTSEIILRFLLFVVGFVSGAVLIAAINNMKRKGSSNNSAVVQNIGNVVHRTDKVAKSLSEANAQLNNILSASRGNSNSSDTQSAEKIIQNLKSKIDELEQKVDGMRHTSAASSYGTPGSAATGTTIKDDLPKTIADMFDKVYALREKATPSQYMDFNGSLFKTNKPDYKKDAQYIIESFSNCDVVYINKNTFFVDDDVNEQLFNVKFTGTIRGDVSFKPCIITKDKVIHKGSIG